MSEDPIESNNEEGSKTPESKVGNAGLKLEPEKAKTILTRLIISLVLTSILLIIGIAAFGNGWAEYFMYAGIVVGFYMLFPLVSLIRFPFRDKSQYEFSKNGITKISKDGSKSTTSWEKINNISIKGIGEKAVIQRICTIYTSDGNIVFNIGHYKEIYFNAVNEDAISKVILKYYELVKS